MTRIDELLPLVQIIATIALLAGISAIVFVEFQETQETTTARVNDTVIMSAQGTATSLLINSTAEAFFINIANDSVTVTNSSGTTGANAGMASFIRGGNYSVETTTGSITGIAAGLLAEGSAMNVSYSYVVGNDARNIFGDGLAGLVEITGWLDLIALAVIAGAIMTIVLSSIGMMYTKGNNNQY